MSKPFFGSIKDTLKELLKTVDELEKPFQKFMNDMDEGLDSIFKSHPVSSGYKTTITEETRPDGTRIKTTIHEPIGKKPEPSKKPTPPPTKN